MHELNPSTLNTIRVITIREPGSGSITVEDAYARIGVPGAVVDNYTSGGVRYPIELSTGKLGKGNKKSIVYGEVIRHPGSDRILTGLVIPEWDRIKEKCISLQRDLPEGLNYIGWDVCLSDSDIIIIEANTWAGFGSSYSDTDARWDSIVAILDKTDRNV